MRNIRLAIAGIALLLAATGAAQDLPKYYDDAKMQRTGTIDSVQLDAQRIIIDDIPYTISKNLIIHSPRAYNVPASRLRVGKLVGYQTFAGRNRLIAKIWLLPDDYDDRSRRR